MDDLRPIRTWPGRALAWVILGCWLAFSVPALAQTFPKLTGRVVDAANIIPDDQEPALEAKLKALEDNSGRQLVVATIPDLQGYPLSDYGYKLGRAWAIGEKSKNSGALLFLAPNEPAGHRGPRIEVGYGLEPILTDGLSHIIAYDVMTPMLKNGDITGAINKGTDMIIAQLQLPPDQAAARAKQIVAKSQASRDQVDISAVIFWLFIFFFFILPLVRSIFGGKRGRSYGSGPIVIWGGGGSDWGGGSSSGGSWGGGGGGGFSGGGGSFGGGGASGGW